MNKCFLYQCPPIDYWDGWVDVTVVSVSGGDNEYNQFTKPFRMAAEAIYLATKYGYYDGELHTIKMAGIPTGDCESELMVALKITNNGTTYIYSERCLPWLAEYEVSTIPEHRRPK